MTPDSKKTIFWTVGLLVGLIVIAGVLIFAVGGTPA